MGDLINNEEQESSSTNITLFGEPIIKTRCQKNALISAISGGIFTGLLGFLFTSNPKKATHIGMVGFGVIGVTYSCYCAYDEINTRKQVRELRQAIYEAELAASVKKK
ncbi:cytochrome c oxidase assembly factor COX20 lethal (3) 87Df [Xylocopa sonorina]|uniref:cytochrome c oxidase assembly factor COX20 lethal (3) 87Df n=1 Tax=Xylocopa sonorina TaxID=1818115 RepID=UPI00403B0FDD